MKMPIKALGLTLALMLGTTSLSLAASVEKLDTRPVAEDAGIVLVADDDDDFRPFWWRNAGPAWQGGDWDDDDRWDDDDNDDDRWDDDDDDDRWDDDDDDD